MRMGVCELLKNFEKKTILINISLLGWKSVILFGLVEYCLWFEHYCEIQVFKLIN